MKRPVKLSTKNPIEPPEGQAEGLASTATRESIVNTEVAEGLLRAIDFYRAAAELRGGGTGFRLLAQRGA